MGNGLIVERAAQGAGREHIHILAEDILGLDIFDLGMLTLHTLNVLGVDFGKENLLCPFFHQVINQKVSGLPGALHREAAARHIGAAKLSEQACLDAKENTPRGDR